MMNPRLPSENHKPLHFFDLRRRLATLASALALSLAANGLLADQVEMQNGDRYLGNVLSLTADKLVLQSDVLGKLTLPREKVALITLGATTRTNTVRVPTSAPAQLSPPPVTLTGSSPDLSAALRGLGANTNANVMEQVRGQLLAGAGPEANKKFDELVSGLASGKLDLDGIRNEARSAASQLRALKKELGSEASEPLDAYLEILERFLEEASPGPVVTQPGAKPSPAREPQTR